MANSFLPGFVSDIKDNADDSITPNNRKVRLQKNSAISSMSTPDPSTVAKDPSMQDAVKRKLKKYQQNDQTNQAL